jgi:uncharacterized membrane protein YphA (DoxX/SURF4 family)
MPTPATTIDVDGFEIRVSNPDKVLFPAIGVTKMELVEYYLTVADAALIGCRDRPTIMHRFPNGEDGEPFYQKRVPTQRPPWIQTATITFPSGRHAVMIAPADRAHLVWMANLACLDLNPWPVRRDDVDHPDELRVDLDPTPGVPWGSLAGVAGMLEIVCGILIALGLAGSIAAFVASGEMAAAYFMAHAAKAPLPILNQGELAVLYCFLFLYVAARGSGVWSIDSLMRRKPTGASPTVRSATS